MLNLNRPPVFTIEPNSTIIAVKGRSVTLNCNVDGNPPPRVDWTRNGKPVPSPADTRRLILPSGSLHITKIINYRGNKPDVGVYQCIATNKVGTTVSRKVKLSVAGKLYMLFSICLKVVGRGKLMLKSRDRYRKRSCRSSGVTLNSAIVWNW